MVILEIPINESDVELFDRIPVLPPRNVPNDSLEPLDPPTPKQYDIEDQVSVKYFRAIRSSESCCKRCFFQLAILNFFLLIFLFYSLFFPHSHFKEKRCDEGFVEFEKSGFCYKLVNLFVKYPEALQHCRDLNSDLVSIHSKSENDFVADLSRNSTEPVFENRKIFIEGVWIGLMYVNDQWKWSDGSRMNYSNWMVHQSDKIETHTGGVLITARISGYKSNDSFWNDVEEGSHHRFVCKKEAT